MLIDSPKGPRAEFLWLGFDRLDVEGALRWLLARRPEDRFAYVVTPNVDHVLRIEAKPELRALYEGADLCLCDSRVLGGLAGRSGIRLAVAPGSDLTPELLARATAGDHIAVVGGDATQAQKLARRYPHLAFSHLMPPMGLVRNAEARRAAAEWMLATDARFTLLAVGSPQQEMIAAEAASLPGARGTALCIGAAIEFVTGAKSRAPRLLQRLSLEWAWRLVTEPRRLARRYLLGAPRIFPLVRRWRRERGLQGR